MNLTEFINTKLKNSYPKFDCYELEKSTPYENSNLSDLELQYLMEGYTVFTQSGMDSDYQTYTYIFKDDNLSLMINYDNPSYHRNLYFYKDNQLEREVTEVTPQRNPSTL